MYTAVHEDSEHRPIPDHGRAAGFEVASADMGQDAVQFFQGGEAS